MTILFMGGEMGAFVPSDSQSYESTASGSYDSAFARGSLRAVSSSSYLTSAAFTGGTSTVWTHFELEQDVTTSTTVVTLAEWLESGTAKIRLRYASSTAALSMEYWNGAAWTAAGGSITLTLEGARQVIDIKKVVNSASGSITLYVAGTERITSGTIDLSGIASLTQLQLYGATGGVNRYYFWSQVIVSTASTIGGRLFTVTVSGAGASSDWTGTFAGIDELVYSDADFINSPTANQVSTFATSVPTLTGYQVLAVGVTARARCGASGPQNLQLALRSAGTNYFSSSKALGAGYTANVNIWETDPATAAAWQNTAISSLQPGVKSIT